MIKGLSTSGFEDFVVFRRSIRERSVSRVPDVGSTIYSVIIHRDVTTKEAFEERLHSP